MKDKEAIELVRDAGYEGYNWPIHSVCRRPEKYGVTQTPAVKRILRIPPKTPQKDKRTLECRITTRFKKKEHSDFKRAMKRKGFDTAQDYSRHLINRGVQEDLNDA